MTIVPAQAQNAEPARAVSGPPVPTTSPQFPKTLTSMDFGDVEVAPPPTRRDRAVLIRMDSLEAGRIYALEGPELRLGRLPDNGVAIDDAGISRNHARLFLENDAYYVEDLGSSNGTYVNGVRITQKADLAEGAVLQVGPKARFRFSVIDRHQERILRQLYESSVRDPLTGVFNRAYFLERVGAELAYAKRHGSQVSLLLLDLDHFKKVNDTYGHLAGDWVLKCFTVVVFGSLRTEDVLARYGGEEFVVALRGVSISGAARAAERLRRAVSELCVEYEGKRITVTVSIGCSSTEGTDVVGAEALIADADRRLYAAKRGGRNTVVATG